MDNVIALLHGGDRRSIGRVPEVITLIQHQPALFPALVDAMQHPDPVVRMRAADAVEKITARHPSYLQPYVPRLIRHIAPLKQHEVRWHIAQILPRLHLTPDERAEIIAILVAYLDDTSAIVKTSALQALADLAKQDVALQPRVTSLIEAASETGSAAVRNRARKLLAEINRA